MYRLAFALLATLLFVKIDVVLVPAWGPTYPEQMTYDHDSGYFKEPSYPDYFCRMAGGLTLEFCMEDSVIPAKTKVLVSLRDEYRHEDWWYVIAGTIYTRSARHAQWEFGPRGDIRYVFDCEPVPQPPPNLRLALHSGGLFGWDEACIQLHSPPLSSKGALPRGYDYMQLLADAEPLNGTALEYLLSDPCLVPCEWEGKQILFLGTTYTNACGDLYAGLLFRGSKSWTASIINLKDELMPDAVYAATRVT